MAAPHSTARWTLFTCVILGSCTTDSNHGATSESAVRDLRRALNSYDAAEEQERTVNQDLAAELHKIGPLVQAELDESGGTSLLAAYATGFEELPRVTLAREAVMNAQAALAQQLEEAADADAKMLQRVFVDRKSGPLSWTGFRASASDLFAAAKRLAPTEHSPKLVALAEPLLNMVNALPAEPSERRSKLLSEVASHLVAPALPYLHQVQLTYEGTDDAAAHARLSAALAPMLTAYEVLQQLSLLGQVVGEALQDIGRLAPNDLTQLQQFTDTLDARLTVEGLSKDARADMREALTLGARQTFLARATLDDAREEMLRRAGEGATVGLFSVSLVTFGLTGISLISHDPRALRVGSWAAQSFAPLTLLLHLWKGYTTFKLGTQDARGGINTLGVYVSLLTLLRQAGLFFVSVPLEVIAWPASAVLLFSQFVDFTRMAEEEIRRQRNDVRSVLTPVVGERSASGLGWCSRQRVQELVERFASKRTLDVLAASPMAVTAKEASLRGFDVLGIAGGLTRDEQVDLVSLLTSEENAQTANGAAWSDTSVSHVLGLLWTLYPDRLPTRDELIRTLRTEAEGDHATATYQRALRTVASYITKDPA